MRVSTTGNRCGPVRRIFCSASRCGGRVAHPLPKQHRAFQLQFRRPVYPSGKAVARRPIEADATRGKTSWRHYSIFRVTRIAAALSVASWFETREGALIMKVEDRIMARPHPERMGSDTLVPRTRGG